MSVDCDKAAEITLPRYWSVAQCRLLHCSRWHISHCKMTCLRNSWWLPSEDNLCILPQKLVLYGCLWQVQNITYSRSLLLCLTCQQKRFECMTSWICGQEIQVSSPLWTYSNDEHQCVAQLIMAELVVCWWSGLLRCLYIVSPLWGELDFEKVRISLFCSDSPQALAHYCISI